MSIRLEYIKPGDLYFNIRLNKDGISIGDIIVSLEYLCDLKYPEHYQEKVGFIIYLTVDKNERRKGYGTMLIKYVLDVLRDMKYIMCVVEDASGNDIYQKCGFELYNEMKYGEGIFRRISLQ